MRHYLAKLAASYAAGAAIGAGFHYLNLRRISRRADALPL